MNFDNANSLKLLKDYSIMDPRLKFLCNKAINPFNEEKK